MYIYMYINMYTIQIYFHTYICKEIYIYIYTCVYLNSIYIYIYYIHSIVGRWFVHPNLFDATNSNMISILSVSKKNVIFFDENVISIILLTKHWFWVLDFLIENYIFIEKLLFSLDTERMDIIFESVASKSFGWTNYQPISTTPSHENII